MIGLDQYGAEPFEQQPFGTAGVEDVKENHYEQIVLTARCNNLKSP